MAVGPNCVRYVFDTGSERLTFEIDTGATDTEAGKVDDSSLPEWTRLETHQCPCCPLKPADSPHCPVAARIHKNLGAFSGFASFDEVRLTVETERRTYQQTCDFQSGLNSMLGLQMATSGCPVLGKLRGMATFHMPFSSFGETLYRTVGAYLIQQFFIKKNGGDPDWDLKGLQAYYSELETLNEAFSSRVKGIGTKDAISNAIVIFFAASMVVAASLEDDLAEFEDYFTGKSPKPPRGG